MGETLAHHGIKGMKWGVRRFQKENGSLTVAGKKRYSATKKDVLLYGEKGAQRIADRRNKGDSRKKAVAKEFGRQTAIAVGLGVTASAAMYTLTSGKARKIVKAGKSAVDSFNNVSILDKNGNVISKYHQTVRVGESAVGLILRR